MKAVFGWATMVGTRSSAGLLCNVFLPISEGHMKKLLADVFDRKCVCRCVFGSRDRNTPETLFWQEAHFPSLSGANVCLFPGTRILPGSLFKRSVPPEGVGPEEGARPVEAGLNPAAGQGEPAQLWWKSSPKCRQNKTICFLLGSSEGTRDSRGDEWKIF